MAITLCSVDCLPACCWSNVSATSENQVLPSARPPRQLSSYCAVFDPDVRVSVLVRPIRRLGRTSRSRTKEGEKRFKTSTVDQVHHSRGVLRS